MQKNDINFERIKSELNPIIPLIITDLVPGGRLEGKEYKASCIRGGEGRSFSINTETGVWMDFATGESGGDIIDLVSQIKGTNQFEAAKALKEKYLNGYSSNKVSYPVAKKKPDIKLIKPPLDASPPTDFGKKTEAVYEYKDIDGRVWFYVIRKSDPVKGKTFSGYCFTTEGTWVYKHWPKPRPVYNLDELFKNKEKPVLIVEGEKACIAAKSLIPGMVCITWACGAQAWDKTDWTHLKDRDVLLWPDGDDDNKGQNEMLKLGGMLGKIAKRVRIIMTDRGGGWDAADALAEKMNGSEVIEWAKPLVKLLKDNSITVPNEVNYLAIKVTMPLQNDDGNPRNSIENLEHLLDSLGIIVRYNVVTKNEEILVPGKSYSIDNQANASFAHLISECGKVDLRIGNLQEFITNIADKNMYNPVVTWIQSKPWDGENRLTEFFNTVVIRNKDLEANAFKETLMRKWMISAVAAAFNPRGVSAHGVLVFQGDQYIGKTKWFKNLVPEELNLTADGFLLRPDDKDSVKQAMSYWMVELGELDATFKKSDIAQLKAFLTKDRDKLRVAYARRESEFVRRTVFFASVNPEEFLNDNSGNRRFWTVECESINYNHGLDMQQIWSEVYEKYYKLGEPWFLSKEENEKLNAENEDFETLTYIEEKIDLELNWSDFEVNWRWRSINDVCTFFDYIPRDKGDRNKIGKMLRKLNGNKVKRSSKTKLFLCPGLKQEWYEK